MALAELPLDSIKEREGFNPRTQYEKDQLEALIASVRTRGLLQPLVVTPNDDGYYLVDGHRRFRAVREAGYTHVPALIRATDGTDVGEGEALIDAVVANQQRVDLTPVEEAKAIARLKEQKYSNKEIAAQLGVSQRLVTERLKLASLPEVAQTAIGEGKLPLSMVDKFAAMAKVSKQLTQAVAFKLVELVDEDEIEPEDFDNPIGALAPIADPELGIWLLNRGQVKVDTIGASKKTLDAIAEVKALAPHRSTDRMTIPREVLEQGAAGGFVYMADTGDGYFWACAVVDPTWLVAAVEDQAIAVLKDERKIARDRAATTVEPEGSADANGQDAAPLTEEELKERKRAERQAELDERNRIHDRNQALGAALFGKVGKVAMTRDVALELARLVLRNDLNEVAVAGVGYCFPHFVSTEKVKSTGRDKHTYRLEEAELWAAEYIEAGETAEDVLGRLVQVLAAGAFADHGCVANSNRPTAPWVRGWRATLSAVVTAGVELGEVEPGYAERYWSEHLAHLRQQRTERENEAEAAEAAPDEAQAGTEEE